MTRSFFFWTFFDTVSTSGRYPFLFLRTTR